MGMIPVSELCGPRHFLRRYKVALLFHCCETVLTRGRRPTECFRLQPPRFPALPVPIRRARPRLPSNHAIKGLTNRPRLESPFETPHLVGISTGRVEISTCYSRVIPRQYILVCPAPNLFRFLNGESGCRNYCGRGRWFTKAESGKARREASGVFSCAGNGAATASWPPRPRPCPCFQENDLSRNSVLNRRPRLLTDLDAMLSGRNLEDHVALTHVHLSRLPLVNFQVEIAGIKL